MKDIFEGTRRKIARHVTHNVADDVLKQKNPEFLAKALIEADILLKDPKFTELVKKNLARKAIHYMRAYFNSQDFIKKCEAAAKGMLK